MSLKKKDPTAPGGLRVAANDPHLVSLGGGRLSTAVTIHYLPVGNMTIGSSPSCSISLNGSGVRSLHCTVYRNDKDEVTIVPEKDARVLIDSNKIISEAKLTQGAMLTIGNSNYLRFNNPAEAQLIKSVMGSNERISMPQIDFTQDSNGDTPVDVLKNFTDILESQGYKKKDKAMLDKITNVDYINMNNFHSPKVFTADSVTVNAPAKDVLGPKYANFAKNLAENHKNDKKFCTKNNEMNIKSNYVNIPTSFIQNSPNLSNCNNEVLTKVNNTSVSRNQQIAISSAYDRYPKPGTYGGLQLFPMNGVNSEINTSMDSDSMSPLEKRRQQAQEERLNEQKISAQEQERLEEILKICAEYERQQNQSVQSSPIVQNRIKTNGSLPREKKSPFFDMNAQSPNNLNNSIGGSTGSHHNKTFFPDKSPKPNSGYENVKMIGDRRVEICSSNSKSSSGYENVTILGNKYVPQSPRTKIRTTCASPKKEPSIIHQQTYQHNHVPQQPSVDYASYINSFEEKLRLEMQSLKDKPGGGPVADTTPISSQKRRMNRNINNLTLNLNNGTESTEKNRLQNLKKDREDVLSKIRKLKTQIAELQRQEDEVLRELDMEKALVSAELSTVNYTLTEMEKNFSALQAKILRLEAQRNANRVMQETQQAKLKQSMEIKQQQVSALEGLIQQKNSDESLKEELNKTTESLDNDRKAFEDLEFQYLEEETDWLAYREELHTDLKLLSKHIKEKQLQAMHLENQGIENQNTACSDTKSLENSLLSLLTALEKSREELQAIDQSIFEISGQQQEQTFSDSDDDDLLIDESKGSNLMSQSLFGSAELISVANKANDADIMSRSVNENMLFHKIEGPSKDSNASTKLKLSLPQTNSTDIDGKPPIPNGDVPRKSDEKISITPDIILRENNAEKDPLLRLKYNVDSNNETAQDAESKMNLNLSLGNDDFEVNPLEKRVPSQDDIDRICKVTLDAPISTKGAASSKIIESIKEIERNRQLLLAQQGSHVIEHARQKMVELKKKSHDEARAQYLSLQNEQQNIASHFQNILSNIDSWREHYYKNSSGSKTSLQHQQNVTDECKHLNGDKQSGSSDDKQLRKDDSGSGSEGKASPLQMQQQNGDDFESSQRHSHPEVESHRERPLSEANSELSYDNLSDSIFKCNKGNLSSSTNRLSENSEDANKRSSLVSNDTLEGNERLVSGNKRCLPKHQRPLTRYLPIMSPDLNLRQHIETAGHQIALCPHVFVDAYSCRGYLHKLGATFHGWSRRWFVLDRQKSALIYYSDKSEKKPRGGAYFSTIDEVYLDHLNTSKSGRPHCTFIVKTKKRSYHLQAASDAAARIWIDAIITGAQGNLDY